MGIYVPWVFNIIFFENIISLLNIGTEHQRKDIQHV